MVFSSIVFLFYFLPVFLALYLCFPAGRNGLLLIFSMLFYAWGEPLYLFLLVASILGNYWFGLGIDSNEGPKRRGWLAAGIAANLTALIVFKYVGFLVSTLESASGIVFRGSWRLRDLGLPLGISFYTFQVMAYLVDVYRRDVPAERSAMMLGNYVAMFPQLVAGPIVRYAEVRRALHGRQIRLQDVAHGLRLFAMGLGAKVLLANTMAASADRIFGHAPTGLSTGVAWFGVWCYALQIYFDFMGYSVMAIGLGRVMGFRFPRNFDSPYAAKSVTEFWHRWHITLSTWFRDYLYIPLGGSRKGAWRTYFNLLLVFLLCGAWHGASFTFIFWGLYQGMFLIVERLPWRWQVRSVFIRRSYLLLVCLLGWVVFRSNTLMDAATYIGRMFGPQAGDGELSLALFITPYFAILLALATGLALVNLDDLRRWVAALPIARLALSEPLKAVACLAVLLASGAALASGTHNPFIYFRF